MNARNILTAVVALALGIVAFISLSPGQSTKDSALSEVQKAVLTRLAEIQNAAQALDFGTQ